MSATPAEPPPAPDSCPHCGAALQEAGKLCPQCGARIAKSSATIPVIDIIKALALLLLAVPFALSGACAVYYSLPGHVVVGLGTSSYGINGFLVALFRVLIAVACIAGAIACVAGAIRLFKGK